MNNETTAAIEIHELCTGCGEVFGWYADGWHEPEAFRRAVVQWNADHGGLDEEEAHIEPVETVDAGWFYWAPIDHPDLAALFRHASVFMCDKKGGGPWYDGKMGWTTEAAKPLPFHACRGHQAIYTVELTCDMRPEYQDLLQGD